LHPQETIFWIISPIPSPIPPVPIIPIIPSPIPILPPPFRPVKQHIELTFFVATDDQKQIQKSIKNAELAIQYFDEIGGFFSSHLNSLEEALKYYLSKKDNLSYLLETKEINKTLTERVNHFKELLFKQQAILFKQTYFKFSRQIINLLFLKKF
jgi:hypothetical protein